MAGGHEVVGEGLSTLGYEPSRKRCLNQDRLLAKPKRNAVQRQGTAD